MRAWAHLSQHPLAKNCRVSNFTDPLAVEPFITARGKVRWRTLKAFSWQIHYKALSPSILVPEGFVFDGATVPWGITLFLPRAHPLYLQAAALHDWMLTHERPYYSRCHIDQIFKDASRALDNPPWRVWALSFGVAIYGMIKERGGYYARSNPTIRSEKVI